MKKIIIMIMAGTIIFTGCSKVKNYDDFKDLENSPSIVDTSENSQELEEALFGKVEDVILELDFSEDSTTYAFFQKLRYDLPTFFLESITCYEKEIDTYLVFSEYNTLAFKCDKNNNIMFATAMGSDQDILNKEIILIISTIYNSPDFLLENLDLQEEWLSELNVFVEKYIK